MLEPCQRFRLAGSCSRPKVISRKLHKRGSCRLSPRPSLHASGKEAPTRVPTSQSFQNEAVVFRDGVESCLSNLTIFSCAASLQKFDETERYPTFTNSHASPKRLPETDHVKHCLPTARTLQARCRTISFPEAPVCSTEASIATARERLGKDAQETKWRIVALVTNTGGPSPDMDWLQRGQ